MPTPTDLLAAALRRDGTRPLLTFYDDASGERVELSVATTANWVAKTAGFLADEYDVEEGDTIVLRLPLHWQAAVVLLAAWAAGAQVGFDGSGLLTVTTTDDRDAETGATLVLELAPMGADFSRLVAAQPDSYVPLNPIGADLVDSAPVDVPNGARVLTVLPYDGANAIGYGLIAPLAVDGSVVLVRNADEASLAAKIASENVTHTLGVTAAGVPRLDG